MQTRPLLWFSPKAALLALSALVLLGCGSPKTPADVNRAAPVISAVDDLRKMTVGGRVKAFADTVMWKSELRYVAVMDLPMQCMHVPGRMLLLGIGGGSIIRNYRQATWAVDVAEPDTARISIVRRSFGMSDASVGIIPQGGREYLASAEPRYDIILLDCIGADDYPTEMMTKEFFALASARMPETGILAIAVESLGWKDEIVRTLSATLATAFRQVIVLPISEPPNAFGSIVLMASNTVRNDLLRDPERNVDFHPGWRYGPEYQKVHAWDNHFSMDSGGMPVQTDDGNTWARILKALRADAAKQSNDYLP